MPEGLCSQDSEEADSDWLIRSRLSWRLSAHSLIRRVYRITYMKGETGERWKWLCAQAAEEQEPERLAELIQEIIQLLDEKEQRLKAAPMPITTQIN